MPQCGIKKGSYVVVGGRRCPWAASSEARDKLDDRVLDATTYGSLKLHCKDSEVVHAKTKR